MTKARLRSEWNTRPTAWGLLNASVVAGTQAPFRVEPSLLGSGCLSPCIHPSRKEAIDATRTAHRLCAVTPPFPVQRADCTAQAPNLSPPDTTVRTSLHYHQTNACLLETTEAFPFIVTCKLVYPSKSYYVFILIMLHARRSLVRDSMG
jgi:hypothetical protein